MTVSYALWCRWRTCTRKRALGQTEANRRVLEAWKRGDGAMHPYHCPYGQHWHVGHQRETGENAA